MERVRRLILHNWFEKLFSILLAVLLWGAVASETSSEIGMEVPLEYRNIPNEMEITGDTTNIVEVRLRGSSNLIREISPGDVSTTLDLSKSETGEQIIPLTPQNVDAPFGIEVVRVNPSSVRLHMERTTSKLVTVIPKIVGLPGEGYEVRQVLLSPSTIEIQGPEGHVNALQSVSTEPIDISGKVADAQIAVDLDVVDPLVRLKEVTAVQVRVEIRPK